MMLNRVVAEAAVIAVADDAAVSLAPVFPVRVGLPIRVAAPTKEIVAS
jgi:hypothetical protein